MDCFSLGRMVESTLNSMHLITSGCSFSDTHYRRTWPIYLQEHYDVDADHYGMGSQGNGMIIRTALYGLENNKDKNCLLLVMLSHPNRSEFYKTNTKPLTYRKIEANFISDRSFWNSNYKPGSWGITNYRWVDPNETIDWISDDDKVTTFCSKAYYNHIYSDVYSQILTLEYILRLQQYCKLNNLKYVFMTYTNEVLNFLDHPECSWLYKQIDYDHFIEESCFEWCKDKSGIDMPKKYYTHNDNHPSTEQHSKYTHNVIIPHLEKVGYV